MKENGRKTEKEKNFNKRFFILLSYLIAHYLLFIKRIENLAVFWVGHKISKFDNQFYFIVGFSPLSHGLVLMNTMVFEVFRYHKKPQDIYEITLIISMLSGIYLFLGFRFLSGFFFLLFFAATVLSSKISIHHKFQASSA